MPLGQSRNLCLIYLLRIPLRRWFLGVQGTLNSAGQRWLSSTTTLLGTNLADQDVEGNTAPRLATFFPRQGNWAGSTPPMNVDPPKGVQRKVQEMPNKRGCRPSWAAQSVGV